MPKLQQITRSNGSIVHSVNIPLEIIELTGWKKGDELIVKAEEIESKKPYYRIVIVRD